MAQLRIGSELRSFLPLRLGGKIRIPAPKDKGRESGKAPVKKPNGEE